MSSLRQLLLFAVLSLSITQFSSATPILAGRAAYPTPSLPSSGEATGLPNPLSTLALKHITIGSGVQNYTCDSNQTKPTSIGALATIYDATSLAYGVPASVLHSIPNFAVHQSLNNALITESPLSLANSQASGYSSLPIIGSHYFNASGTPVFDLIKTREVLYGKKIADIPAPEDAMKGCDGHAAVDWLALVDNGKGKSVGLAEVFRVETAGGGPPANCDGVDAGEVISVQYSAEYWFYG